VLANANVIGDGGGSGNDNGGGNGNDNGTGAGNTRHGTGTDT
jgi:hypothetical protein